MFIYPRELQARVAGPNMLPSVVSVSSCLLHIPRLQSASTAKHWRFVLSTDGLWNSSYKSQGIFSMQQARSAHIGDVKFHIEVWSFIGKTWEEVPMGIRSTSNLWFLVSGQHLCFQKALQWSACTSTNTKIWQQSLNVQEGLQLNQNYRSKSSKWGKKQFLAWSPSSAKATRVGWVLTRRLLFTSLAVCSQLHALSEKIKLWHQCTFLKSNP